MLQWILIAAATVAILYLVARSLKRLGEREQALPPASTEQATSTEDASARSTSAADDFDEIAKALEPVYERSVHPQLLERNPIFQQAAQLLAEPTVPLDMVLSYCVGASQPLSAVALEALSRRPDSAIVLQRIVAHLYYSNPWTAYFLLRYLVARADVPVIGAALVQARGWWSDNAVMPGLLADFISARLAKGEQPDLGSALQRRAPEDPVEFERLLRQLPAQIAGQMAEAFERWRDSSIDLSVLGGIGLVWTREQLEPPTVESPRIRSLLADAMETLQQRPAGSVLVVGETGTGKTAFIRALAGRLMSGGWTFFQASGSEVLAGQVYIGQLEERVQQLLRNLGAGRRVVWYVPQFHELLYVGRHSQSPIGLLDLLLPAMESRQLCIVGELKPAALEKLLQQRERLRFACTRIDLTSADDEETLELGRALIAREFVPDDVQMDEQTLKEAHDLARHYLHSLAAPGRLLNLLRHTRELALKSGPATRIGRDLLLTSIGQMTGLPRLVVDERQGLDPKALRQFFEARVMGQPEALSCLVDRIAMLKAGLTDPNRPIGVFLFAGPTGTGKTEVAKVLAEFLFGSATRMIRLDMSELHDASSHGRLLGEPNEMSESDALVHRIRRQPFSVVLLDEFEKAHPRVWDLFLQVFDDARLSDALGNVVDFRHSIIILTSNLGAIEHHSGSLGFVNAQGAFTPAQVMRTIGMTFRPEFVNRIDRVVVFRPLSKLVMRDILRKELRDVLQRRGFRNRDWAVEWEESAIDFLLQKGFTPDMGARPLRRAIDEYVLAPIAMTIVENRFPEGDQFLFVRAANEALEVEFVDPDAPTQTLPPVEFPGVLSYPPLILSPTGSEKERLFLGSACAALEQRLSTEQWIAEKRRLLDAMRSEGFWSDEARFRVLSRLENIDSIEAGLATCQSLLRRLAGRSGRMAPTSVVSNLAQLLYLLQHALDDLEQDVDPEVFLAIEPLLGADSSAHSREWAAELMHMYREWARKRRMRCETLSDRLPQGPAVLAMSGFGAHAILARETGIHVFEIPDTSGSFVRCSVRVRVAPQPLIQPRGDQDALQRAWAVLEAGNAPGHTIVRRYRRQPSPLVRDALAGWRTGKLEQVLRGDFDLMTHEQI